jgi:hypothetical protein
METLVTTNHITVHDGIEFHLAIIEHMAIIEPSIKHVDETGAYAGYSGGDFLVTLMITDGDVVTDGVHTEVRRGEAWRFKSDAMDVWLREFAMSYLGYDEDDPELYQDVYDSIEVSTADNGEKFGTEVIEV